jgi:pimeloyl-ACP methyl ester carboxylesterase
MHERCAIVAGMRRFALWVLGPLVLVAVLLVRPLAPRGLGSHPHPAASYADAMAIVDSLRAADSQAIAAECRTEIFTHGAPTKHVVILLHGLTNCPAQFDSLARLAFARGANVLVPRLPHHGLADRMTGELARLDARELVAITERAIDAAHGLGDTVTVAGLSIGGVMAAWAGQERADVDRAVVIAPMLGWARAPGPWRTAAITRLGLLLPNQFAWWDGVKQQALGGPTHVYPRFASRSVAATMWLGGAVLDRAAHATPAARSLVLVTVGGDAAADNGTAAALVRHWQAHGAREVLGYEFPAGLHLSHDVVDPEQVGGNPSLTYPVLLRYISR